MAAIESHQRDKRGGTSVITGPLKAALWLLSADEDLAVEALAGLDKQEIRRLRDAVREIKQTTPEELAAIHAEVHELVTDGALQLRGSLPYLTRLTVRALGEDRARSLLDNSLPAERDGPTIVAHADIDTLALALAEQHPQIIAAVTAQLEPDRATVLLETLPEELRTEVLRRVAHLARVPTDALAEVEEVLAAGLSPTASDGATIDGARTAAVLLNRLKPDEADRVLAAIEDDEISSEVRRAMFTFEDLASLDRRGFQTLLKEVPSDQLLLALKTGSEALRSQIFSSLSKRAAAMLKDDLEISGPARLADVEAAQAAVVEIALQLRSEGRLTVAGKGGDEFV